MLSTLNIYSLYVHSNILIFIGFHKCSLRNDLYVDFWPSTLCTLRNDLYVVFLFSTSNTLRNALYEMNILREIVCSLRQKKWSLRRMATLYVKRSTKWPLRSYRLRNKNPLLMICFSMKDPERLLNHCRTTIPLSKSNAVPGIITET